jgi:hypothetical protein
VSADWAPATLQNEGDWSIFVGQLQSVFSAANAPPIGYYVGAWVGLSAPTPIAESRAMPQQRFGLWLRADGARLDPRHWFWTNGSLQWGAPITGEGGGQDMTSKWGKANGWHGYDQPDNSTAHTVHAIPHHSCTLLTVWHDVHSCVCATGSTKKRSSSSSLPPPTRHPPTRSPA